MSRRERLRIAWLSAWPLLPAIALYGALAARGAVPVDVLPALAVAAVVWMASTYVRTAGAGSAGSRARRGRGHNG